jgi:hypothetical protein
MYRRHPSRRRERDGQIACSDSGFTTASVVDPFGNILGVEFLIAVNGVLGWMIAGQATRRLATSFFVWPALGRSWG